MALSGLNLSRIRTSTAAAWRARPHPRRMWKRLARAIGNALPKGLYARSLIIIIAPVVLLQSVIAYTFMERHWQLVTRRLSAAVTADVAAMIDVYESYPQDKDADTLTRIAGTRLNLDLDILKGAKLPLPGARPFFSILDETLSEELAKQIGPAVLDRHGGPVQPHRDPRRDPGRGAAGDRAAEHGLRLELAHFPALDERFVSWSCSAWRSSSCATRSSRSSGLADVAESFGKGREIEFRPRGAREVRQAGHAFIEMKRRIERAMEQRTTMLNGVSHDLRTIITRFKLSLALVEQTSEVEDLQRDVDEMSRMLEAYLAFARGDSGEAAVSTDMRAMLDDLRTDVERLGAHVAEVEFDGRAMVTLRPDAFRRCLFNLAANAARYGETVAIRGRTEARSFVVSIDDDGPGIPPESREEVFKPFVRLDDARQDAGGSGLGLAIARDIARAHGGDVALHDSPLGGLRATVRIPA